MDVEQLEGWVHKFDEGGWAERANKQLYLQVASRACEIDKYALN
jgi:hypothetical protein